MLATDWLLPIGFAAGLGNHLWQSTLVLVLVWAFTRTLRENRAAVRHRLWLAASLKFLIPFSAVVLIGRQYGSGLPIVTTTPLSDAVTAASEPFSNQMLLGSPMTTAAPADIGLPVIAGIVLVVWALGFVTALITWGVAWRRASQLAASGEPLRAGRIAESLARVTARMRTSSNVMIVLCDTRIEPGIFGIWRPILLWPGDLTDRLSEAEIDAIVAHELCHVHRRDNLTSSVHSVVRAVFWFYPALWWVGKALHVERERACDEEVLRSGYAPRTYAEGIVKTCEFCIPAHALAAAGVTGNLRTRVVEIMGERRGSMMGSFQRITLTSFAIASVLIPLAIGISTAPYLRAQAPATAGSSPAFEVASIKPNIGTDLARRFEATPGGRVNLINLTTRELIFRAYQTQDHLVIGGPGWLGVDRFDVVAKAADNAAPQQMLPMVRTLLADRFRLVMHRETREMPIYNLVLARPDGRGVQPKGTTCVPGNPAAVSTGRDDAGRVVCGINRFGAGEVVLTGNTLDALANRLGSLQPVGRTVVNRTGLDGRFDFELTFTPGLSATHSADGLSLFTALEEQAGLKLEPARGPVEVLVVDSVERPAPD